MSDTHKTNESNEERGLITYADPANPGGPMLKQLPTAAKPPPRPAPKRRLPKGQKKS